MAKAKIVERSIDENGWRTTTWAIEGSPKPLKKVFAVCIKDDPGHLTLSKLYNIAISGEDAWVTDDNNEVSLYSLDFFVPLPLSRIVSSRISAALSV